MARFEIPGRLPGLNEYTDACRRNPYAGAKLKQMSQERAAWAIRSQLKGYTANKPVVLRYAWVELDRRRDKDNIAGFGHKVIQDALVECGTLKGDGWRHIKGFSDDFEVDKNNPRVIVTIEEVEDD